MASRREFLSTTAGVTGALAAGTSTNARAAGALERSRTAATLPRAFPSPAQRAWQDHEVGMFVHFAPNTWQEREYDDRSTPLSAISPDIDTDQWVDAAAALGARYVVLVAKHAGGFCLWQTTTTEYSIRNTPWKGGRGDVMADLAQSCRDRGLQFGVYLSPRDDSQAAGGLGRCATPERQVAYDALYRQQLTELLTRYGPICEIWFDGSCVVPTGDLVHRHAPDAMVFQGPQATIRWVGNEDGFAPYPGWNAIARADAATGIATALHGDPDGEAWMPLEVDVSLRRPNWFWSTTNHVNLLSTDQLLEIYYRSVGRGAQLLLNVTPDRTGRVPEADARRVREFGDEVRRRFATPLGETAGMGRVVTLAFPEARRLDHVVMQEALASGERVRGYRLEARVGGAWALLGTGSAIGHTRIQPVGPVTATAVRLTCTEASDPPVVRRLAAFDTAAAPPPAWRDAAPIWAADAAGTWSDGRCEADLTRSIPAAAQYRVRFVAADGEAVTIADVALLVGGTPQPQLVRAVPGRRDVLVLTVPGLGQPIVLRARLRGAPSGTLLLQRL